MYIYVSNMNIYHLKYFLDAARLGSVSKSADLNRISHSAVSQAIKSLEQNFETELIYHSKRRFQLTAQGEQFLIEGQRILNVVQETRESLQSTQKEVQGELTIWSPQSLIVDSLYRAIAAYREKYPKVKIKLLPGAAAQVRSAVMQGSGNIGFMVDDGFTSDFESVTVKKGQFILVAKKKSVALSEASFMVTSVEKIEVRHLLKGYRAKFKKEMSIEMEVMSWGVIKNLAEKNFAVGYLPDYCVEHELSLGRIHKLASPVNPFQYSIMAIWPKNRKLHSHEKLFLELLKAEAR